MKQLMLKGRQEQALALFESSIELADSRAMTLAVKLYGKIGECQKALRCFGVLERSHPRGLSQVSIRVGLKALEKEDSWRFIVCGQLMRKFPLVRIEPESFDVLMDTFPIGTARGLLLDAIFNPSLSVPWTHRHLVRIAAASSTGLVTSPSGSTELTLQELRDCFGVKLVRSDLKALMASNHPILKALCSSPVGGPIEIATNTPIDPITHSALNRLGRNVQVWSTDGECHQFPDGSSHPPESRPDDPRKILRNACGRVDDVMSSFRYLCSFGNTKSLSAMIALKKWLMSTDGPFRPKRVLSPEEIKEGLDWIDENITLIGGGHRHV
ncbi:hypothetical protein FOL47_005821 [Perkinsus chesapeaki]|uniref:Tetratricopeptide repeat protein n=1 Tax=Perkinsus chesapeaki TaxID=330153 RepID=A0A7J6LVG8_PERCH|nr:hypothetical protein FOL47_005821 [Perkinsus chesapeaki]